MRGEDGEEGDGRGGTTSNRNNGEIEEHLQKNSEQKACCIFLLTVYITSSY